MKNSNIAFLVVGLYNQHRLDNNLKSIERLYRDTVDVYYGCHCVWKTPFQQGNYEWAQSHNTEYLEVRQEFLPKDDRYVCEAVSIITMSKWLYDNGYDEVYIIHNDVVIWRDFLPEFRGKMNGDWSYVAIMLPFFNQRKIISREEFLQYERPEHLYGSNKFLKQDHCLNWRISIFFIILNKKFVYSMYEKYGNEEKMYNDFFKDMDRCGDISFLEVIEDCNGFIGEILPYDRNLSQELDTKNVSDTMDITINKPFIRELKENENIKISHGNKVFEYMHEVLSFEQIVDVLENRRVINDKTISGVNDINFFLKAFNFEKGLILGGDHEFFLNNLKDWKGELTYVDCARRQLPLNVIGRDCSDEDHAGRVSSFLLKRKDFSCKMDFLIVNDNLDKYLIGKCYDFIILDVVDLSCENITRMLETFISYLNKGGLFFGFGYIPVLEEATSFCFDFMKPEPFYYGIFGARIAVTRFCEKNNYVLKRTLDNQYYNWWYFFKE